MEWRVTSIRMPGVVLTVDPPANLAGSPAPPWSRAWVAWVVPSLLHEAKVCLFSNQLHPRSAWLIDVGVAGRRQRGARHGCERGRQPSHLSWCGSPPMPTVMGCRPSSATSFPRPRSPDLRGGEERRERGRGRGPPARYLPRWRVSQGCCHR